MKGIQMQKINSGCGTWFGGRSSGRDSCTRRFEPERRCPTTPGTIWPNSRKLENESSRACRSHRFVRVLRGARHPLTSGRAPRPYPQASARGLFAPPSACSVKRATASRKYPMSPSGQVSARPHSTSISVTRDRAPDAAGAVALRKAASERVHEQ